MESKVALVVGASGLVGSNLVDFLLAQGWHVIATFSRAAPPSHMPEGIPNTLTYITGVDLVANNLADLLPASVISKVTHMFYSAWRGPAPNNSVEVRDQEECEQNMKMLTNIVNVLDVSCPSLERVVLVHGTKWYGVHLGPHKVANYKIPFSEDDPRVCPPSLFYYHQQDWLTVKQHNKPWTWSAVRPFTIIGFSQHSPMNFGTALAVFASVLKEQNQPLIFPAAPHCLDLTLEASSVLLLVKQLQWAAVAPEAANNAFNAVNGDYFTWREMWPKVAQWFGMSVQLPHKDSEVVPVKELMDGKEDLWRSMITKYNLRQTKFADIFNGAFLQGGLGRGFNVQSTMQKAHSHGFTESQDSSEMYKSLFSQLARDRWIPPFVVGSTP